MFKLWLHQRSYLTRSTIFAFLFLFFLPFTVFTVSLLNSSKANAASVSDNVVENKPYPVTVGNQTFESSFDVGFFLGSQAGQNARNNCEGFSNHISQGYFDKFKTFISNGSANAILYYPGWIEIWVKDSTSIDTFDWSESQLYLTSPGNHWMSMRIDWRASQSQMLICGSNAAQSDEWYTPGFLIAQPGYVKPLELNGITPTYPDGYEGAELPVYTPPGVVLDWIPDLNIVTASGYQLIVQDKHFNTFDGVPFTCNEGLTPLVFYEIWQGDDPETDVMINSGSFSATIGFHTSLPTVASKYVYVAWYSCGDLPTDPTFQYSAFMPFEMNAYGALVSGCDSESFQGLICSMGGNVNIGIFSSTLNGFVGLIRTFGQIDSTYCNTNWTSAMHFEDNFIGVQNIPAEICSNVQSFYLTPGSSFHPIKVWVNVLMSGTAVLLLVFGLLALFGLRGRLTSPIGEGDGNAIRPDIATNSSVIGSRGQYVKGPSSKPLGISGDGGLSYRRSRNSTRSRLK